MRAVDCLLVGICWCYMVFPNIPCHAIPYTLVMAGDD